MRPRTTSVPRRWFALAFILTLLPTQSLGSMDLLSRCLSSFSRLFRPVAPEAPPPSPERFLAYRHEQPRTLHGAGTEDDNRRYLAFAEANNDSTSVKYVHVTLKPLKTLNDGVLKNPQYADAARNLFRSLLIAHIHEDSLLKTALKGQFVDFKSMEFAFAPVTLGGRDVFESRLNGAITSAQMDFDAALVRLLGSTSEDLTRLLTVPGRASDPRAWHIAGYGTGHPDFAAAQTRFVDFDPERSSPLGAQRFSVQAANEAVSKAEAARTALEASLSKTRLMTPYEGTGQHTLSRAAIEELRLLDDVPDSLFLAKLNERFRTRFGIEVSKEQAHNMREYRKQADRFQPPVRVPAPVVLDFSDVPHGYISVDFAGQGVENLRHTMGALIKAAETKDNPGVHAIGLSRQYDAVATGRLNSLREGFERHLKAAGINARILYSGDDGGAIPDRPITQQQWKAFLKSLKSDPQLADFRLVWSPPGPGSDRTVVARAEKFEKRTRDALKSVLGETERSGLAISSRISGPDSLQVHLVGTLPPAKRAEVLAQINEAAKLNGWNSVSVLAEN